VPPPPKPAESAPAARPAPAPAAPAADARREPSPTGPGRILVRSTPAGATVSVDGREYGRTPVAVRDLARGTHRVRIEHDGYAAVERRVTITAARPAQSLTIPLARASGAAAAPAARTPVPSTPSTIGRFAGTLVVESRPSGARVFLDNKAIGTTPLSVDDIAAGEHALRLEHDGYRRWSSMIRIVAAERNRVTASLER
jgi:hypothetical protein